MKCAEDVTLVPIHFINELLHKLIRQPGRLTLPRNMLAWHKNATVSKQCCGSLPPNAIQMFTGT